MQKKEVVKKLDILLLRSYAGPFILTFFISLFVLVMQFLWKYIDELAGKGLEFSIILELLVYASATLVPMALPLAILLSSIMTMGSLAEHLELVACKASGISLLKLLRPLIILSFIISGVAFVFANYGMPIANYKLKSLLFSIQRTKPAIDVQEAVFYDGLKDMVIYVDKKGADEKTFFNLLIYDHTQDNSGNGSVTMARRGAILPGETENILLLKLFEGIRFDDRNFYTKKQAGLPMYREKFNEQEIRIDLSEFKFSRNEDNFIRNQFSMMTIRQLDQQKGKLIDELEHHKFSYFKLVYSTYGMGVAEPQNPFPASIPIPNEQVLTALQAPETNDETFTDTLPPTIARNLKTDLRNAQATLQWLQVEQQNHVLQLAREEALKLKQGASDQIKAFRTQMGVIARNETEWHRKFSLSFACIVLFFIGAPLGAIIRKGGLGFPLIAAIIIFIIYHVLSTIGEKAVKQLAISAFEGMWLSSLVLFPFGLFLTLKASSDSNLFKFEWYVQIMKRWIAKRKHA